MNGMSFTMIVVAVMAAFVTIIIINEVFKYVIKKKKSIAFNKGDVTESVVDYIAIIIVLIYCINKYIYNLTQTPGLVAIIQITPALFCIICVIIRLSKEIREL